MAANHTMVDMETLATKGNAVITTLAAIRFDPFDDDRDKDTRKNKMLYQRYDIETQQDMGRQIDPETVKWWGRQSAAAQEEAFGLENRIELKDGFEELSKFLKGSKYIWGHGSMFDVKIMEDVYDSYSIKIPWQFWNIRDTRTLFALGDPNMPMDGHHHALADSMRQVLGVQNIYRDLKIVKQTKK